MPDDLRPPTVLATPVPEARDRLAERILMGLLLGGIAIGCVLVLRPFVSAILWAAILVFTTWPVFEAARLRLRLRRSVVAALMVTLTAVVIVLPVAVAVPSSAGDLGRLRAALESSLAGGLPDAPPWLFAIPLFGRALGDLWNYWVADLSAMFEALRPYLGFVIENAFAVLLAIGNGVLMFAFALFMAFFLFVNGEPIAARLRLLLQRIAGAQADRLIVVTGLTVRGTVYGLLGTAVVQGILTVIGLEAAGVPRAALLGALAGMVSVLPIGAPVIWIPAAIWLMSTGHLGWGIALAIWGFVVISGADSVIRPWFIAKGAHLPFLLTVLGVLGGALAFGLLGIFLGPVLLGVGFTLVNEWALPEPSEPA